MSGSRRSSRIASQPTSPSIIKSSKKKIVATKRKVNPDKKVNKSLSKTNSIKKKIVPVTKTKAKITKTTSKEEKKEYGSLSRNAENSAKGKHFEFIIGVDEAGRGPLAGPVVAAACMIDNSVKTIDGIMDSKALTKESDREIIYEQLINTPGVQYGVSVIDHKKIDEINILQATMLAMRKSTEDLLNKLKKDKFNNKIIALIDGNRVPEEMPIESKFVIKGDGSIFSIAAASVIAKVTRDRIMHDLHNQYPMYNFIQHKGYPTGEHVRALAKHGPCPVHRYSYGPVKKYSQ